MVVEQQKLKVFALQQELLVAEIRKELLKYLLLVFSLPTNKYIN